MRLVARHRPRSSTPVCVLGDVDVVRALSLAGLTSVVVCEPDDPVRFSRHVRGTLEKPDHWTQAEALVEELLNWAGKQDEKPVLIPQTDGDLLMLSRHRTMLSTGFVFDLAHEALIEDLVHKERFQALAERLQLDVPRAVVLAAGSDVSSRPALRLPVVVKPVSRRDLADLGYEGKAISIDSGAELSELWRRAADRGLDVLAQELVPGPESRIESWHAFIDDRGKVVGDFCGRKIRTWPLEFGHSTAVEIAATADVARAGRELVERLGLTGLVKVDYKRDPAGALRLLEVNPRATLWHHPGAVAGVNLSALVHAHLTGRPHPPVPQPRTGVTWCAPQADRWAAAAAGVPALAWIAQTLRCPARSGASWSDPAPYLRGQLAPAVRRRLSRRIRRPHVGEPA